MLSELDRRRLVHRYEIILCWSNADQAVIAVVPELPGCMAHGDTYETALGSIQEAIQSWIETAQEVGRPVPEPMRDEYDFSKGVRGNVVLSSEEK